jgi:hypothetical protein
VSLLLLLHRGEFFLIVCLQFSKSLWIGTQAALPYPRYFSFAHAGCVLTQLKNVNQTTNQKSTTNNYHIITITITTTPASWCMPMCNTTAA